jgi:hypothetical protein
MFGCLARLLLVFVGVACVSPDILAHDSWISRGGLRNAAGEWCCGAGDCALMDPDTVSLTSGGYSVSGWGTIDGSRRREFYQETVPEKEAQPSPDGAYWRCKRPDGSRRCFFAPPPAT